MSKFFLPQHLNVGQVTRETFRKDLGTTGLLIGYLDANTSIPANGVWTVVTYTVAVDQEGWYSSGRYTPEVEGYYRVAGQLRFVNTGIDHQIGFAVRKNGTTINDFPNIQAFNTSNTSVGPSISLSGIIELDGSTDYIEFMAYNNNTSSHNLQGVQAVNNIFVEYIGANNNV